MNLSALSSLPVWAQASRGSNSPGVLATTNLPGGVVTFLLASRHREVSSETTEVVQLCIQKGKEFLQRKLRVDVKFPADVGTPPFQEILVAAGAQSLALFSPSCCAIVALHDFLEQRSEAVERCEALMVLPRQGQQLAKVAWHPMSDAHLGVLSSDGSWSLLNLALSLDEPEVHFPAPMGAKTDVPVDFQFLAPNEEGRSETAEDLWLSLSVFFLTASGRISFRNPVVPSAAVLSRRSCEALRLALSQAASCDRFAAQLAAACEVTLLETSVLMTHRHHLHGGAQPFSLSSTGLLEQVVEESEPETSSSSSSSFCSMQVCCSSPLVVIARATANGFVELLALQSAIGPFADPTRRVTARVLEEIDLMCNKSTEDDFVRLQSFGDRPGLIVHTRSLLASIDVSLTGNAVASVTTLAETRSNDMDFASWSLVDKGVGLLLRMERSSKNAKPKAGGSAPSKSFLTVIELPKKDSSAEKSNNFSGHSSKLSPSSLHLLEQPLGSSKVTSAAKPSEVAKRVATLRSGIASIQCRQDFLKHLAEKSFPARAEVLKQELSLDASKLLRRAKDGAQRAKELQERQEELVQRQAALVKALSAASEARHLEDLTHAVVPKLYAQLYELRRAAELLHSSQQALVKPPEGVQRPKGRLMLAQN